MRENPVWQRQCVLRDATNQPSFRHGSPECHTHGADLHPFPRYSTPASGVSGAGGFPGGPCRNVMVT